jgi:hypothetical protein
MWLIGLVVANGGRIMALKISQSEAEHPHILNVIVVKFVEH